MKAYLGEGELVGGGRSDLAEASEKRDDLREKRRCLRRGDRIPVQRRSGVGGHKAALLIDRGGERGVEQSE